MPNSNKEGKSSVTLSEPVWGMRAGNNSLPVLSSMLASSTDLKKNLKSAQFIQRFRSR